MANLAVDLATSGIGNVGVHASQRFSVAGKWIAGHGAELDTAQPSGAPSIAPKDHPVALSNPQTEETLS